MGILKPFKNFISYSIWSKLPQCWTFDHYDNTEKYTQHYIWSSLLGRRIDIWRWYW